MFGNKCTVRYDTNLYCTSVQFNAKNSGVCDYCIGIKKFHIYVFIDYEQTGPTFNRVSTSFVVVLVRSEFNLFVGTYTDGAHTRTVHPNIKEVSRLKFSS